ncbi:suppressor of tub2 mutation [Knufia obscura]|uniref:Suppressor of tub2 mutation n=1 Tax=Knufia obscura TaxID=1635080 RepID=A0ABR0RMH9_9EURO|nr:suppressor of tub2 mutation [Knufia obscura]
MDYSEVLRLESAKGFRLPGPVTEDNWKHRMDFCNKLTATIDSYGKSHLPKDFTAQIEPYLNNIVDCARSERTQLSNSACKLLGALPKVLERDMHPHLDRILPDLIKLCANTKQVTVKVAAAAVANMVQYSTYNNRLLWHVCMVFEDKPPGPKQNGTAWLQTIMKEYYRSMDPHKDLKMIARALLLALEDADATVRTNSRATYWTYSRIDPDGAAEIMEKLDQHKKTALQNDPHNPDKKNLITKKQPPRPRSALAEVRKEQAKKKREEEAAAAQKPPKPFSASTASHDSIEIHEPRKDKPKKEERGFRPDQDRAGAGTALFDRTSKDVPQWSQKRDMKTHTKALSQDEEVVTKPSASSRLLSAPVRRPRINVTPMNSSQNVTARPSSRTGHTTSSHNTGQQTAHSNMSFRTAPAAPPKEVHKDSRPTSSSSSKSATIPPFTASTTSTEKRRPISSPSSKRALTTSSAAVTIKADVQPEPYIPEGKENAIIIPTLEHKQSTLPQGMQPAHKPVTGAPLEVQTAIKSTPDRLDFNSTRRFLNTILADAQPILEDALLCRKFKSVLEQRQTIIPDKESFDYLFSFLCLNLATKADAIHGEAQTPDPNWPYIRQLMLQMTVTLLQRYPTWTPPFRSGWIRTMMFYRCTLPNDPKDRRTELCMKNISTIINECPEPLDFIRSVVSAINEGEAYILADAKKHKGTESLTHAMADWLGKDDQVARWVDEVDANVDNIHFAPPRELALLYETGLSALTLILEKGIERDQHLNSTQETQLCKLADHALESYSPIVKRSVIGFAKYLFTIIGDRERFFGHYTEETKVNLLEYYLYDNLREIDAIGT